MGLELNTSAYKRKKKSPGTNSGTYWQKIYTKVSATCKQTITLGVHSGGMGVTGAVVGGGNLPENGGGFPLQSGAR